MHELSLTAPQQPTNAMMNAKAPTTMSRIGADQKLEPKDRKYLKFLERIISGEILTDKVRIVMICIFNECTNRQNS